ncbi:MAG: glutamate synthase-related protein, partial [Erythrobacter sp.]
MRYLPLALVLLLVPLGRLVALIAPFFGGVISGLSLLLGLVGLYDLFQNKSAVLKNYPLVARLRFLFEHFRPEIRQYFLESDHEETPFSREQRALVYRRAKGMEGLRPFGTLRNVNEVGHEWINHSMMPSHLSTDPFTVTFGGPSCKKPYNGSVLNISGMSYGALSPNAIEALNQGAKAGGFAHTTGEGSISKFHRKHGGDLIWQIGSGYFGCRTKDGKFDPEKFSGTSADDQVKMIEIKLSQGA